MGWDVTSCGAPAVKLIYGCIGEFAVADIDDIKWSDTPFNCLSIPEEQKDTIMALAEARMGKAESYPFDDVIVGKGRGLNVVLQ